MIKIFNIFALSLVTILLLLLVSPIYAKESNAENLSATNSSTVILPENEVYFEDDVLIINDYQGVFLDNSVDVNHMFLLQNITPIPTAFQWIKIGIAILKFIAGVLSVCQSTEYVTGHDVCRTVIKHLTTPPTITIVHTYELQGMYIPGYIPGCEPKHSLPCNSGYWKYKLIKVN